MYDPDKRKFEYKYYSLKNSNHSNLPAVEDYDKTLYKLFSINPKQGFDEIPITDTKFPEKAINRLRRAGVVTLDDVFSKNIFELLRMPNYGEKSIPELLGLCEQYLQKHNNKIIRDELNDLQAQEAAESISKYASSLAGGSKFYKNSLSEPEITQIQKVDQAFLDLGKDLFELALTDPGACGCIENNLVTITDYMEFFKIIDIIRNKILIISNNYPSLKESRVISFLDFYPKNISPNLSDYFSDADVLANIPDKLQDTTDIPVNELIHISNHIVNFLDWTASDIIKPLENICAEINEKDLSKRRAGIVELRADGYSLEQIGNLLGVTRERIRQLSTAATNSFVSGVRSMDKDPVSFIHILTGSKKLMHKSDLASYLQNDKITTWLWACLQDGKLNCKEYEYSSEYDAVIFLKVEGVLQGEIDTIINSFPDVLKKDKLDNLIRDAAIKNNIPEEIIKASALQKYISYGQTYSKNTLSKKYIIDWILLHCFPSGYKVNNESYEKRFRSYMSYYFGEKVNEITTHHLESIIGKVGILYDRGKYIHPSRIHVNTSILKEIDLYIHKSSKTAISYKELYDNFKFRLNKAKITNQYFLKGIMKYYGAHGEGLTPYYSFRDYVTKDKSFSKTDELESFIIENSPVHKSDIVAVFPEINDATLLQTQLRCPEILNISSGMYIHASAFDIRNDDYILLRNYLEKTTSAFPVNIRIAYSDCISLFPEFIKRNGIANHNWLFAILFYMFRDEFSFSKPYISRKGNIKSTNRSVILSILQPYNEINIDELLVQLDNKSINYNSLTSLMNYVYPDYIRTDRNKLTKIELTGLNDSIISNTLSLLAEEVEINGYMSSRNYPVYTFPAILVPWNDYILECLVINNDIVDYIFLPLQRTDKYATGTVYVTEKFTDMDSQSFVLKILAEEYDRGTFTNKNDMKIWLKERGLIENNLPSYLETAQFYYYDEKHKLRKK
ncbi:MAG: hypothetical protein IJI57_12180 [Flexilinea sp.]|nr:hypothetical protein [Flexilinea sp.]